MIKLCSDFFLKKHYLDVCGVLKQNVRLKLDRALNIELATNLVHSSSGCREEETAANAES